jgi:hypothetical protein
MCLLMQTTGRGKYFMGQAKKNGRNFLRAVFRVDETVPHCFQMKR